MVGMVKVTSLLTLAESVLGFISFGARAQAEMHEDSFVKCMYTNSSLKGELII